MYVSCIYIYMLYGLLERGMMVCISVYIHMYMYLCIYMYTYICIMYTYIYLCIYTDIPCVYTYLSHDLLEGGMMVYVSFYIHMYMHLCTAYPTCSDIFQSSEPKLGAKARRSLFTEKFAGLFSLKSGQRDVRVLAPSFKISLGKHHLR